MYSSSEVKKRLLMKRSLKSETASSYKSSSSRRSYLSTYLKLALCILILYCLNLLVGLKSYFGSEKSFEDEYHLTMTHIDITKAEENPEKELGPPKNILPNNFLIENKYFCGRSLDPDTLIRPHLLILVKSSCENLEKREAIRLTWGEKSRLTNKDTQLAFVLGTDPHNTSVERESKKYGDIIQIDKIDYYYYSSYKMIMMLRWIGDYCSSKSRQAPHTDLRKYVLFVDDDYYIDLDFLLSYIYTIDEDQEMTTYERRIFVTGEVIERSRPERFVNDRWFVSVIDYPYDLYPPFVSTGCFLMTRYNARLFYIASKYTRLFYFDQIYIGLLAYSMSINFIRNNQLFSTSSEESNIILSNQNQNHVLSRWRDIFNNKINSNSTTKSVCIRTYSPNNLIQIWNHIHQTNFTI